MFYRALLIFAFLFLVGCGSGSSQRTGTIEESSGILNSINTTTQNNIILSLEASKSHKNDTGAIGYDRYKVKIDKEHTREYCLENDLGLGHRFTIQNEEGSILLNITHGCSTVNLTPAIYTYKIYNGTLAEGRSHTVFIHPKVDSTLLGMINPSSTPQVLKKSFQRSKIKSLLKHTVISFNKCRDCNLEGTDLSNLAFDKQYSGNYLAPKINNNFFKELNTTENDFFSKQNTDVNAYHTEPLDIKGSSLINANLSYSIFRDTDFTGVNFKDANLSHAVFIGCSFAGTNLENVDMTRAIFIKSDFSKEATYNSVIVSKPSITRLFKWVQDTPYYDLIAAVNDNNRLVLFNSNNQDSTYNENIFGTQAFMPKDNGTNLKIISPPVVVTNNFTAGFSVFVRASDGFIHEFFKHGNGVIGPARSQREGWYKIDGTDVCKSNPDATFKNVGGSGSNEIVITLTCHDNNAHLYVWKRYFYNDQNNNKNYGSSRYGGWSKQKYSIPKTDAQISTNRYDQYAYVENNILYRKRYKYAGNIYSPITFDIASDIEIRSEEYIGLDASANSNIAYVKHDGNVSVDREDVGIINPPIPSINLGHPQYGALSTPALGSLAVAGEPIRVIVLSGDGKLYAKHRDGSGTWTPILGSSESMKSYLTFKNNNLTEAYIEDSDLNSLDLSSNNLTRTFFTNVKLDKSKFENMTLNSTVFDASSNFNNVLFKSSTLNSVHFTNNKNIINVNFTNATINGLIWTNNIAECSNFNSVTFGNENILSNNNKFISSTNCPPASFVKAKNVPVELIMQKTTPNLVSVSAQSLRDYNFTSASFSDSFYTLNFKKTDMEGANFGAIDVSSSSVDFKNIDASGSTWKNADLSFIRCDGCTFNNTVFNHTNLYQAKMNNASFISSVWNNTNATYAQFQNGTYDFIYINKTSSIVGTHFNKSVFYKAVLSGLNFKNTSFFQSKLNCSDLSSNKLSNSNFSGAQLVGSDLSNPSEDISSTSFENAYLNGANFKDVTFGNSNLSGSKFDFSGDTMVISPQRTCTGYATRPNTTSNTTCQDGNVNSSGCTLK